MKANGATPAPDEKAVTGCELDSSAQLIREIREIREQEGWPIMPIRLQDGVSNLVPVHRYHAFADHLAVFKHAHCIDRAL